VREREEKVRRRLDAKVDDHLREARREIDAVIERLKSKAAALSEQAAVRLKSGERLRAAGVSTGDIGAVKADARAALDELANRVRGADMPAAPPPAASGPIDVGARVAVGTLGLEGVVMEVHGKHAEVDVRGKRLRARIEELRVVAPAAAIAANPARVRVNVDMQPRGAASNEINVIGASSDEAVTRVERFLDEADVAELRSVRIIHGYGTGQLRRSIAEFLRAHSAVANFGPAPDNQGGGGVTVVELKD
jgi:DNA mismatch repair protein MutS2